MAAAGAAQNIETRPRKQTTIATTVRTPGRHSISAEIEGWKEQTQTNPANAVAWLNYYIWTDRYDLPATEKKHQLDQLASDARKQISNTAEYQLILFLQSGKKDGDAIQKAVSLNRSNADIYMYGIQFLVFQQSPNNKQLENWCRELEKLRPLSDAFREYHYNALMSADSNAVIYAKGLNDLVPMAVLQQVHGVRKDISLRYYTGNTITTSNTYLCLSTGSDAIAKYPNAFYTGLLIKINGTEKEDLQRNINERFKLQWLDGQSQLTSEVSTLYKNYLPGFLLLYRMYKNNGDARAQKIKTQIEKIAINSDAYYQITQALEK
ncbi:MAG TPA: hypothetical protein VHM26_14000 [Chitinophagaceae bacterium]|jgi:hypothetical protein|nr:hypothetical protein [Chitinophagaceae bacterium]